MTATQVILTGRFAREALQRVADAGIPLADDDGTLLVQAGGHTSLLVADELVDDVREVLDDLVVGGERPAKPKTKRTGSKR